MNIFMLLSFSLVTSLSYAQSQTAQYPPTLPKEIISFAGDYTVTKCNLETPSKTPTAGTDVKVQVVPDGNGYPGVTIKAITSDNTAFIYEFLFSTDINAREGRYQYVRFQIKGDSQILQKKVSETTNLELFGRNILGSTLFTFEFKNGRTLIFSKLVKSKGYPNVKTSCELTRK